MKRSTLAFDKEVGLDELLSPQFSTTVLITRIKKERLE